MEITNKVIVVTGGAGGIGLAIAKEFIKENPKIVILVDISFKNFNFQDEKIIFYRYGIILYFLRLKDLERV